MAPASRPAAPGARPAFFVFDPAPTEPRRTSPWVRPEDADPLRDILPLPALRTSRANDAGPAPPDPSVLRLLYVPTECSGLPARSRTLLPRTP